jgi:hypothetical protein
VPGVDGFPPGNALGARPVGVPGPVVVPPPVAGNAINQLALLVPPAPIC